MTRIHWAGDFANEAQSGDIIARNGALLTIRWDGGRAQVIPECVTQGRGWRYE